MLHFEFYEEDFYDEQLDQRILLLSYRTDNGHFDAETIIETNQYNAFSHDQRINFLIEAFPHINRNNILLTYFERYRIDDIMEYEYLKLKFT